MPSVIEQGLECDVVPQLVQLPDNIVEYYKRVFLLRGFLDLLKKLVYETHVHMSYSVVCLVLVIRNTYVPHS